MIKPLIVSAALASAAAASPTTSSSLSPPGSAATHHMHHQLVHDQLREFIPPHSAPANNDNQLLRRIQGAVDETSSSSSSCPGTPFLWKITNDNTNDHVGFAIGTMHLPAEVVSTQEALTAIGHALEDSCDVYGELNIVDANVTSELRECSESIVASSATVNDIPSESLRNATKSKILEITLEHIESNPDVAPTIANRIADLPLQEALQLVLYGNTPEYTSVAGGLLYSGSSSSLDLDMLKLGRPADDLEEVSTQCDILKALYPTKEDFIQNFNDQASAAIEASLDASLSQGIELYKCGDIDTFVKEATAELLALDEATDNAALTERNNKMAERINNILQSNPDERITFAVGVSHWLIGDNNLQKLLKEGYGYSMEHIPDWNKEMAEDHSHSHCEVVFHPELGLYVDNPPVPGATPVDLTPEPTHNVIKDTYYTNPPSPGTAVESPMEGMVLVSESPSMKQATPASPTSGALTSKASKVFLTSAALLGFSLIL